MYVVVTDASLCIIHQCPETSRFFLGDVLYEITILGEKNEKVAKFIQIQLGGDPYNTHVPKINQNTWTSQILRRNSTMDGWDMHPVIISQEYGVVMSAYTHTVYTWSWHQLIIAKDTYISVSSCQFSSPKNGKSLKGQSFQPFNGHSLELRERCGTHRSHRGWQNHRLQRNEMRIHCSMLLEMSPKFQAKLTFFHLWHLVLLAEMLLLFHLLYVSFDWKVDPQKLQCNGVLNVWSVITSSMLSHSYLWRPKTWQVTWFSLILWKDVSHEFKRILVLDFLTGGLCHLYYCPAGLYKVGC